VITTSRLNPYSKSPNVMKVFSDLNQIIEHSKLDKSLVALVKLRVSQLNTCSFCVSLHYTEAVDAGISAAKLSALDVAQELPEFTEKEKAVLDWAECLTFLSRGKVAADKFDRLAKVLNGSDIITLTALVNLVNTWNRFAKAFAYEIS